MINAVEFEAGLSSLPTSSPPTSLKSAKSPHVSTPDDRGSTGNAKDAFKTGVPIGTKIKQSLDLPKSSSSPCCPLCWVSNRMCLRTTSGHCRRCEGIVKKDRNLASAQDIFLVPFHYLVFKDYQIQSLASLDTTILDTNILELHISTNQGRKSGNSLIYSGSFSDQNEHLVSSLDEIVRSNFSSTLLDELGSPPYVATATLAGGYAHLLCSSLVTSEGALTFLKGVSAGKSEGKLNLEAHFKYLVASRLIKLFGEVLGAPKSTRFQPSDKRDLPQWDSNAYAACGVLLVEIRHLIKRVRSSNIFGCGENYEDIRMLLHRWLSATESELNNRLREDCGRFQSWQSNIRGSLESLKFLRRSREIVELDIRLFQYQQCSPVFFDPESCSMPNIPSKGQIAKYLTPEYYGSPSRELDQVCPKPKDINLPDSPISITFPTSADNKSNMQKTTTAAIIAPMNDEISVKTEANGVYESTSPTIGQFDGALWDQPPWQAKGNRTLIEKDPVEIKAENIEKGSQSDSSSEVDDESYSDEPSRQAISENTLQQMHEHRRQDVEQGYVSSILSPIKLDMVERIMKQFWVVFNQRWAVNIKTCADSSSGTSSSQAKGAGTASGSKSKASRSKRKKDDDDDNDRLPSRDGDKKRRTPKDPSKLQDVKDALRFACPFNKHDPRMYNIYSHRACASSDWESISRVKEHIYRCHQMPIYCRRCWEQFEGKEEYESHIMADRDEMCDVISGQPPQGISPETEKLLKSRKKASKEETEEDRWIAMYRILFPDDLFVPSPYFGPAQGERELTPETRSLTEYENHMRRELPRIVRARVEETIARETRPLEESMLESLMSVIRDSQEVVFRTYRDQSSNPNRVPSNPNLEQRNPQQLDGGQSSQSQDFLARVAQPPPALPEEEEDLCNSFALPSTEPNKRFNGSFYDSALGSVMQSQDFGFGWECNCDGACNLTCLATSISSNSRGEEETSAGKGKGKERAEEGDEDVG